MLKELLEQRGISVYKMSKDTEIAYSTLNDLVIEKTDIKNSSAQMLYRIAKYLDVTMEYLYEGEMDIVTTIYLYNSGRDVILEYQNKRVQYLGPKNLICFHRINKVEENTIYADCCFQSKDGVIYQEEDYLDLTDILAEDEEILSKPYLIQIGKPSASKKRTAHRQSSTGFKER